MAEERSEIAGSVVPRSDAVRRLRPADPKQIVESTIVIRRPPAPVLSGKTRAEIEKSLSASPEDIIAITAFAQRYGLTVKEVSPEKRIVRVEAPAQNMNRAFGINLAYFEGPKGTYLSYDGPLRVDSEISAIIAAVLGLNQEPVAKSHA